MTGLENGFNDPVHRCRGAHLCVKQQAFRDQGSLDLNGKVFVIGRGTQFHGQQIQHLFRHSIDRRIGAGAVGIGQQLLHLPAHGVGKRLDLRLLCQVLRHNVREAAAGKFNHLPAPRD